jgi:hypothetical protein
MPVGTRWVHRQDASKVRDSVAALVRAGASLARSDQNQRGPGYSDGEDDVARLNDDDDIVVGRQSEFGDPEGLGARLVAQRRGLRGCQGVGPVYWKM